MKNGDQNSTHRVDVNIKGVIAFIEGCFNSL